MMTTTVATPSSNDAKRSDTPLVRDGLLCILISAVCVLLIYPVVNGPCGDDFSYMKTALDFEQTGKILYNGWATAMLGWLIPWGALFIKLFGFSFTILRISSLAIAAATIYLLHQVLSRFGLNRQNAIFGTLTVALSPIFLFMATSYLTDVPGLLVILVCIYMCQRAIAARTDNGAVLWLISAALLNVGGGTVRQIAWLGALVMVPSTAWVLRERRGTRLAGILAWLLSLAAIVAYLHWFNKQPYSVPEAMFPWPLRLWSFSHLGAEIIKTSLCLLLVVFPVLAAWMTALPRMTKWMKWRFAIAMISLAIVGAVLYETGVLAHWTEPWLIPLLAYTVLGRSNLLVRVIISLLLIAPAIILIEDAINREWFVSGDRLRSSSWMQLAWILGPFSLSYALLLIPRATMAEVQDRYLLGLAPVAIIILLKLHQEHVRQTLPAPSFIALIVLAVIAVGDAHDLFAASRAVATADALVVKSGVPRRSLLTGLEIESGWARDGWIQIEDGGHINDGRIKVPVGAFKPYGPDLHVPPECYGWFLPYTPAIHPTYFAVSTPKSCFAPTNYPVIHYRTWFPPFHRAVYVQKLKTTFTP